MNENDKDWSNPTFRNVYAALAMADRQEPEDAILNWLNRNGFCNLTCCPVCHVDDFTHVEGCTMGNLLDRSAQQLEQLSERVFKPA